MSAAYPATVKSFSVKKDFVDTVDAADPNTLQDEVVAIEAILGVNPHVSTAPASTDTFVATSTTFATLAARLANIEKGIVGDTHVHYVHLKGGDTITPGATGTVGLTYKALASQTANFVEFRSVANALLGAVSVAGAASFTSVTSTGTVTGASFVGAPLQVTFHISGLLTTGLKIPKWIATQNCTLRFANAVCDSGSGAVFLVRLNKAVPSGMVASPSVGMTVVTHDFTDVSVNAGQMVQIEVLNAGSSASDLSVTIDAVTR